MSSDHVLKLVRKTQEEMMADRGFTLVKKGENWPSLVYQRGDEKMIVYYMENTELKKSDFDNFNTAIGYIAKTNTFTTYKNIILIYPDQKMTSVLQSYFDSYKHNPDFQSFSFKHLTFNPTKRMDAPKVRIIPSDEEEKLLKEMGVVKTQLPIVSSRDAMMSYYGVKTGSIVEFERYLELETMTPYTYSYRRVI